MSANEGRNSTRTRSPAYPSISLKKAIEQAEALYKEERRNAVHVDVALEHWGYDATSSNGLRAIAALKQFGLLLEEGKRDERKVRFSPLALDILMPEKDGSAEHEKALRNAALSPPIHRDIWEKYAGELPSDPALRRYLVIEKNFNDAFVDKFLKQFRATIAFAKLAKSDKISEDDEGDDDSEDVEDEEVTATLETKKEPLKPPAPPAVGLKDFPLYTSDQKGALYVPSRMSKKDFDLLKKQIESCLGVIECTSVVDPSGTYGAE